MRPIVLFRWMGRNVVCPIFHSAASGRGADTLSFPVSPLCCRWCPSARWTPLGNTRSRSARRSRSHRRKSLSVARDENPINVKALIQSDYAADPANVKAVFLFGHVPVVRSGNLDVDGHQPRPMPADVFYGDMDGDWTDSDGDGVFDQNTIPTDVELEVGRVDFADLPGRLTWNGPATFPGELELLRQYLNKDHSF